MGNFGVALERHNFYIQLHHGLVQEQSKQKKSLKIGRLIGDSLDKY